jgi:hypothetical protein
MSAERQFRLTHHSVVGLAASLLVALLLLATSATAASLTFTVNASEPVTVTGTPRFAIDVGGTTRYATYVSGSGTSALTFAYAVQPGDFDANGITLASPVDLNGGSISDIAGNPTSALTFTLPDTSALKVQTYTAAFTTSPITNANANAVGFAIAKAPPGASFTYTITSSGGSGSVTGSGTISNSSHTVSGVDVSALPSGTLTLSVTISTMPGGTGAAKTATSTPTFTGVLDSLPATGAAFSVRRLSNAYAGPLMRVRRSSDNATQNIGATIGGNLDTTALASFCGTASCSVAALYDQSGNVRDAVQANAAYQPLIVSGGVTELEGARPAMRFVESSGQFLVAPAVLGQTINGTFNVVARLTDTTVSRHPVGDRGGGGRIIRATLGGSSYVVANIGAAQASLSGSTLQQRVVTLLSGSSGMSGALDGTVSTGGTSTVSNLDNYPFWIGGGGYGQSAVGDWIGTISEATVFNATLTTAERQALERDQGGYYGIAVP